MSLTKKQSQRLNAILQRIDDDDKGIYWVPELVGTGKVLATLSHRWSDIDFTKPIYLSDCADFIGFVENGESVYPKWQLTDKQDKQLISMLSELSIQKDKDWMNDKLSEVFQYMQRCTPNGRDVRMEALEVASLEVEDE